ncbi:MAG: glycosyltransferase [Cyanobacteria bacterium J06634_6]
MYVDIAFSLNRKLQVPLLVVINSILHNVSALNEGPPLRFNILVPPGDRPLFTQKLREAFAKDYSESVVFRIEEFTPPDFLKHYLDNRFKEREGDRRISRYMQYARLFLKHRFPDVTRVIYLDCDTLVLGDVRSLFALGEQFTPQQYLSAVPQFIPAVFYFTNPFKLWDDIRRFTRTFNSGVLLTDLSFWTEKTYESLRHYLNLDAQNDYKLFRLGDETVFNLMFKETYIPLDKRWNASGYGNLRPVVAFIKQDLEKMSIIHWSGGYHKPWEPAEDGSGENNGVVYADIWRSYLPTS